MFQRMYPNRANEQPNGKMQLSIDKLKCAYWGMES